MKLIIKDKNLAKESCKILKPKSIVELSDWWLACGLSFAYPYLFESDEGTRIKNEIEYNNFKKNHPNFFYKFWKVLDVPAVIGFEACTTEKEKFHHQESVQQTNFKIRLKKSFDRVDLNKIYEYARYGNNSMGVFTDFLQPHRNESSINKETHREMNKLANECFLGNHKNYHTVTHVMNSTTLNLTIDQCQNLCNEKNTDSWEDHISLESLRSWNQTNTGKPTIPVESLHSDDDHRTVCNWGNNPSRRFRSIVIEKPFLGLKECWPDQKSFVKRYWPLEEQRNTFRIIEFIKHIFDVYKVNPEPFKNKLYNIQEHSNTKSCHFDIDDVKQPQNTSVAWVFTIAVGIILVLTILWNLDEIMFKIKLKSFPRKYKIEQGEYSGGALNCGPGNVGGGMLNGGLVNGGFGEFWGKIFKIDKKPPKNTEKRPRFTQSAIQSIRHLAHHDCIQR